MVLDEEFESYNLKTATISDYLITDNNPDIFTNAVTKITEKHRDVDLIITRPFSTPQYQKRLMEQGFLDSMHFPLNQEIKPGAIGLRLYDERCLTFREKPWYVTQADCF